MELSNPASIPSQALNYLASRLIDLSKRNRLLNAPVPDPSRRGGLSAVPILLPDLTELYDRLASRERPYYVDSFIPLQPSFPETDTVEASSSLKSNTIYSSYPVKQLNSALANMRDRGRASINERGVNILFAAFGFIEWADPASADDRWRAPLILFPVTIDRQNGGFVVSGANDETLVNPALLHKFSSEYAIQLPSIPDDPERAELETYLAEVEKELMQRQNRFHNLLRLDRSVNIGIFSFAKIAMFRELTQVGVANLMAHHTIAALVDTNYEFDWVEESEEDPDLDAHFDTRLVSLVVEADSSQVEAIYRSQSGRNLAIQGPPGTGKSQTIVNLIADALSRDQTILFVAEKRVALDVVYKRLKETGLGNGCLVIHPGKAQLSDSGSINKKSVLDEIERAWYSQQVNAPANLDEVVQELSQVRKRLNDYVAELHRPRFACEKSFFQIFGISEQMRTYPVVQVRCKDAGSLTVHEIRQRQASLDDFEELEGFMAATELDSPWFTLKLRYPSPDFVAELKSRLEDLNDMELELVSLLAALRERTGLPWPDEFESLSVLCDFLAQFRLDALGVADTVQLGRRFAGKYANFFKFLFKSAYQADSKRLQPLWLRDWSEEPREIAAKLEGITRVRAMLQVPPGFAPAAEDLDLSGEAARLVELISGLKVLAGYLAGVFDPGVVRALRIQESASSPALEWARDLLQRMDELNPCLHFRQLYEKPECAPLREFIQTAVRTHIPVLMWRHAYERRVWETLLDAAYGESPTLAGFSHTAHERAIVRFRELDRQVIQIARYRIANRLARRKPPITGEIQRAPSSIVAILMREFRRKRIMPLRKLFSQASAAILDIKPCFMMSPLTVSQYLDPAVFQFDVVIFDEASQLRMEDTLGSIYRAKQVIVVGDEQQLPPTRFFEALDSGDEYDEEAEQVAEAVDFESILTRAEGEPRAFRQVDLRWHYRSRHEELIAFSNKNFYNNRLYTFPNSEQNGDSKAVHFVYVRNGVYDRGRSRTNRIEAQLVAEACIEFARQHPTWTLGVVTFSEAQRHIIEEYVDGMLRKNPDMGSFFAEDREGGEPFMVKNLELIQGDERDCIFFSFGYGRDATGAFTQNFGPLNQAAGRRRLNVAVTRARQVVYLFSSVQPEELTSEAQGVQLMKEYMGLARDGLGALFGNPLTGQSLGEVESPFEEAVANRLRAEGLEVHSQVGVSGYRIDLGVIDPLIPGRYVLGVECDGAAYHSGKTARDRDRLRQQVLEGLGWRILRIWSKSWNENPERETKRVLEAVKRFQGRRDAAMPEPTQKEPEFVLELDPFVPVDEVPVTSIREIYSGKFSKFTYSSRRIRPGYIFYTAEDIAALINEQGPTQMDSLIKQVSRMWGYSRLGDNIKAAIVAGIRKAEQDKKIRVSGRPAFVYPAKEYRITIREAKDAQRDADEIPLEEFHLALWLAVSACGGSVDVRDAIRIGGQLLGFQRATGNVTNRFNDAISQSALIESSLYANVDTPLIQDGERLMVG